MTNLIKAVINIIENPNYKLTDLYQGSNRINNKGDALEFYIKDVFCNSLNLDLENKVRVYSQKFSYIGNKNNPPDAILKNSDAIEIKKIENISSALALNSSYPKNKLYSDDSRITSACRECEEERWIKKDILYAVGSVDKNENKIKFLWFIYGDCYSANREIYQRILDKISDGIEEIADIELFKTNEIAKVKKVDPLGITDLRVRGMWHIENPINVFKDVVNIDLKKDFILNAIMLTEKYNSFSVEDRARLENLSIPNLVIKNIEIRCPDNPAQLLPAKLISYAK